jgi:hypothetical protein
MCDFPLWSDEPTDVDLLAFRSVARWLHLLERGHGERFAKLMDKNMPDWKVRREAHNQAPLGQEEWVRA